MMSQTTTMPQVNLPPPSGLPEAAILDATTPPVVRAESWADAARGVPPESQLVRCCLAVWASGTVAVRAALQNFPTLNKP